MVVDGAEEEEEVVVAAGSNKAEIRRGRGEAVPEVEAAAAVEATTRTLRPVVTR